MAMDRQEYPTMLATLQPSQAVTVLNERTKHIHKTNEDVANWLLERKKAEEAYAQALKRLAKKSPPDSASDLGVFDSPWRNILKSVDVTAEAHAKLAQRIEVDVERPLREFGASNRQMQQLSTVTGNLQSLAKDYDYAQRQTEKARGKAGNRIATASSQLETAAGQWESTAPYVFENLQAADESRWNHLRDVLTQLQTHQAEAVQRTGDASEKCLNALLNMETGDEIKTFAIRNTGEGGVTSPSLRRQSSSQQSERRASRDPTASNPSLPPPLVERASNGDTNLDATSQRSSSIQDEKKSKLGGLRRLGTVMGRRRSMMPKSTPSKSRAGNLSAIPDEDLERTQTSSDRLGPSRSRDSNEPARTFSGISESQARPGTQRTVDSSTAAAASNGAGPVSSGPPRLPDPLQPTIAQPAAQIVTDEYEPPPGPPPGQAAALQKQQQQPAPQPAAVEAVQPSSAQLSEPREANGATAAADAGYSIPPSILDPITQAQQEASGLTDSQPYKMDIRNAPIADESSDAQAAMASVASNLRAQAAPVRRSGTNRGRRDVRNTVFVPSAIPEPEAAASSSAQTAPAPLTVPGTVPPNISSPAQTSPVAHRPLASQDSSGPAADNQSIRSGHSLASASNAVAKHPDMHDGPTGINTSIIETSSAWFGAGGALTRALVIGELALAHNSADFASAAQLATIRLDQFQILEKVAPNPSFVHQPSGDRPGEFSVDLSVLGGTGRPQVAFKYQVHVAEGQLGEFAPLVIAPLWKVEALQTRAILNYSLNPAFAAASTGPVTLRNVVLSVHLEGGARASACQSKPAGTFVRERGIIYWKLDELSLTPGAAPERLIARFTTDGEARGRVEARWELADRGSQLGVSAAAIAANNASSASASDPFADDSVSTAAFSPVAVRRRLVSGTYTAA